MICVGTVKVEDMKDHGKPTNNCMGSNEYAGPTWITSKGDTNGAVEHRDGPKKEKVVTEKDH